MPILDSLLSHLVCGPPLVATGSSLCNPSHISTGLLYGNQQSSATSICGSRMILKCHAGSCHRCRTKGYTLALQVGDWTWSYCSHNFNFHKTPTNGEALARKRTKTPKKNTNNLHSKQYFPEYRLPAPLCNRRTVLCVKQERELKRGYRPHKIGNWTKKLRWRLRIDISNYEPGDRFLRNAVSM